MPTTAPPQTVHIDPDGVPVELVDISGDILYGTLWGAVRADGALALLVSEAAAVPSPVTPAQALALADALDPDRAAELAKLRVATTSLRGELDRQAGQVIELAETLAAEKSRADGHETAVERLRVRLDEVTNLLGQAESRERNARNRYETAEQALAVARDELTRQRSRQRELRRGQVELVRASLRVEERHRFREELAARVRGMRQLVAVVAATAAAAGYTIGRNR